MKYKNYSLLVENWKKFLNEEDEKQNENNLDDNDSVTKTEDEANQMLKKSSVEDQIKNCQEQIKNREDQIKNCQEQIKNHKESIRNLINKMNELKSKLQNAR